MNRKIKLKWYEQWHIVLYFALLLLTIVMVITTMFTNQNYKIAEYDALSFQNQWNYEYGNGVSGMTDLPGNIEKTNSNVMTLSNTLPKIEDKVSLIYRSRHTTVRIFLDGDLVYDNTEDLDKIGRWFPLVGNIYHEVNLTGEDSGKEIRIEGHCESKKYLAGPGECYIGDRGSFILHILKNRWVTIICSLTLFIVAFGLFFIWLILKLFVKVAFPEGLCLGLFTIGLAIWMMTETQCIQFIAKDTKFISLIAFEILILIPVPIALFFFFASENEKTKKMSKQVSVWPLVLWIINNLLHVLHIIRLQDSLILTQIMILTELGIIAFIQIRDLMITSKANEDKRVGRYWKIPIAGICVLVPFASIETVKYMFDNGSYKYDGLFISIGVLVYIMSLALSSALQLSNRTVRLQAETETKSQFLANMSHEIRTPLNAILGYGEMILRESHDDKVKNYAVNIQNAGDTLRNIINSILDITKIESGKMEIYSVEYNTVQMIDNIMSVTEALAEKKGLRFVADIDEALPSELIGDENHIRQIVMNLTNNAVKYTQTGSITLTVKLLEKIEGSPMCKIYFSVKDTGIGIKEEDMGKLFEKFERLDQSKNYHVEGTGLGMSIVVSLLKAMNSKIEVESVYGEGSNFFFILEQCYVGTEQIGSFENRRRDLADNQIANADFVAPNARILLVDDLEMNRNVACDLLEPQQMKIDTAESGEEAIEKVRNHQYDLILMDHMMPGMDGIEATQRIRDLAMETNDAYFAMVPILALTANAMVGMKDSFIQAGMQDFISKPIELHTLISAIKKWLPKDKIQKIEGEVVRVEEEWNLPALEGFDHDVIRQFNVSQAMFEKNIRDFYRDMDATKNRLLDLKKADNKDDFKVSVHGLKSVSKFLGAMEISNKALEMEMLCIDQKHDEAFADLDVLLEIMNRYEAILADYLQEEREKMELEVCTIEEYLALMAEVKDAADNFDMEAFMELETRLDQICPPEEYQEEFAQIQTGVRNASFMDVSNMIASKYELD